PTDNWPSVCLVFFCFSSTDPRQVEYAEVGNAAGAGALPLGPGNYAVPQFGHAPPQPPAGYPGDLSPFLSSAGANERDRKAKDKDEIASRVPDALLPRLNRSLKKSSATRERPVIVPYDKTGSKFGPPPTLDSRRPAAVVPPYKTYSRNENDVDSEEYRPVRVAKGYEDRYDPNYNPTGGEESIEGSQERFEPRPRAERYRGPPPPPIGAHASRHDARSSRHQDFSGEQRDQEDFHPEDKRHYDLPPPGRPSPIPPPSPRDGPANLPKPMAHTGRAFTERRRNELANTKLQPLGIVYALPQNDGTYRLQPSGRQKAIQIQVDDPNEVMSFSQLGLTIDDAEGLEPTENVVLQHVGEHEPYRPTDGQQLRPPDNHGVFVTSGTESVPTKSGGLFSTMSRWSPLGGWGIGGLFGRRSRSSTQATDPEQALLNHQQPSISIGVPLEIVPHVYSYRPSPGHEMIVTHPSISGLSDDALVDLKAKHRQRRSLEGKASSPPGLVQPMASGFMPSYSEDDEGYYTPYTLRTIASLANIFRATDDDKEETAERYTSQRPQPRYEQAREPRSDTRQQQEDGQLGSGNFEVIRGGIFNEEVSNNQIANNNNNNNNYFTNNPYRATVVQEERPRRQQRHRAFESFDDDDPEDQVFGFQGFEDFSAPLNNALSRHRHLLGAAASEKRERAEPLSKAKEDHLPSATEHFTVVDRKMLAEE
ncbi:hypothetical protein BIW11_14338, partial [Tropilaelaps mercedesae]